MADVPRDVALLVDWIAPLLPAPVGDDPVVSVRVQHDHWCLTLRTGVNIFCNCRPDYSVRPDAAPVRPRPGAEA